MKATLLRMLGSAFGIKSVLMLLAEDKKIISTMGSEKKENRTDRIG